MTTEVPVTSPAIALRDGRAVAIRALAASDNSALQAFGQALPDDEWLYLQHDLRNHESVNRLVGARDAEHWRQIVGVDAEGQVAAYGAVQLLPGRSSHVADIQMIVGGNWRRSGLGTALAHRLVYEARALGATKVIVDMVDTQDAGRSIFERLGFREEGRLISHARGRDGNWYNLLVLALVVEYE